MIVPLLDRVLLEKVEAEKKTESGIVFALADAAKEKPSMATIVAVGPGKSEDGVLVPMGVEVGQTVIFKQYAGTEVKHQNKEYLIVEIKDILAIVE